MVLPTIPWELRETDPIVHVNPTGRFVTGGPMGDAGLTGRKIIVDSYGGMARHGGGAFSGKDPTKVDRSAAYAARWVAKNVVAAGLADRFEVEVAYGIGIARPISLTVESFGTGTIPDEKIQQLVEHHFDLRPAAIIEALDLRRPIYRQTAAYGHFGREDLDLPWERTDKAADLAADAGLPGRSSPPRAEGGRRGAHRHGSGRQASAITPAIAAVDRRPFRRACQTRIIWPTSSSRSVSPSIIVATALVSGVTPRRTWPKMNSGSVDDPGPDMNVVMTKSSKLNVNDSRNPATIAGSSCGNVIWRKVRQGVANRSALASVSDRSMPDRRARTSSSTRLRLNNTCAAMIVG